MPEKRKSWIESFRQIRWQLIKMMKLMLDRFQEKWQYWCQNYRLAFVESEPNPFEYKDVPLKTTTIRCKLIYRNSEIVDNIHFFKYANLNDYNQTSENEISQKLTKLWSKKQIPLDEQVDICFSEEDQEEDDESINIGEFEIDDQSSLLMSLQNEIVFGHKPTGLGENFSILHLLMIVIQRLR